MRQRAASLAALALLILGGCGGDGDSSSTSSQLPPAGGGGTLTYALPSLPSTLDPLAARGRAAQTVSRQIYEPLIASVTGPYGQTSPQRGLALTARPSGDRTTWTLNLRVGVHFQDGSPFNAAAVLANSRRWQTDPRGRVLLPHLFAVDAPRPDEVRFLLDQPVRDLPRRLSSPRLGIVSPQALEPQSGQSAHFVADARGSGTGAFRPEAGGPARLELSRYAGWWGSPMGLGPALDGVTFVVAPLPGQRFRLLSEGRVQVADPLDTAGLRAAEADPLLNIIGSADSGIGMEGSVRGISSARSIPALSGVWLTRLTG